jgi:serine/threonine-protein kinase HipA
MKVCLCCNLPIEGDETYHRGCLRNLFGQTVVPEIPFSLADFPERLRQFADKMSISGAQIKALVRLDQRGHAIEFARERSTHILKPEPSEYPRLPENENLCMAMAARLGMEVPPHGLFPMADGRLCYIIRRFDRTDGQKLHKEDFAQLLEKPSDAVNFLLSGSIAIAAFYRGPLSGASSNR